MSYPIFQYALLRQKEMDLERESERARLAALAARVRPPLRRQLGAALVRLGTRVSRSEPVQLRPRRDPCITC